MKDRWRNGEDSIKVATANPASLPAGDSHMRFNLLPREMKFFDMFDEVAVILTRASGKFLELVTDFDRLPARSKELKFEERACDEVIGRIIQALDLSFITPFDREDIHTLAAKL